MKQFVFLLTTTLLASGLLTVQADTIELKSGEKLEGKIVLTSDKQIVMEVQVTPSIKEEQTIEKADVARVQRLLADEEAFLALKDTQSPATVSSVEDIDSLINGRLKPFLKEYPKSNYAAEVERMIATLEKDRARVEGGEVRLDGKWIAHLDYMENLAYYEALFQLNQLQTLSQRNDLSGALNAFHEYEKKYSTAAAFPDAVLLTLQNLQRFERTAGAYLQRLPQIKEKREKGLAISSADIQAGIRDAVEQQRAQEAATIKQAKEAGLDYYPLFPENEVALEEMRKKATDDMKRLSTLNPTQKKRAIDLIYKALAYSEKGESRAAEASLKQAEGLWSQNDFLKDAKDKIAAKKAALEESAKQQAKSVDDAAVLEVSAPEK